MACSQRSHTAPGQNRHCSITHDRIQTTRKLQPGPRLRGRSLHIRELRQSEQTHSGLIRAYTPRSHLTGDRCGFSSTHQCVVPCAEGPGGTRPPPLQLHEEEDGSAEAACSSSGACENVILAQVPASRAKLCKELGQQWC